MANKPNFAPKPLAEALLNAYKSKKSALDAAKRYNLSEVEERQPTEETAGGWFIKAPDAPEASKEHESLADAGERLLGDGVVTGRTDATNPAEANPPRAPTPAVNPLPVTPVVLPVATDGKVIPLPARGRDGAAYSTMRRGKSTITNPVEFAKLFMATDAAKTLSNKQCVEALNNCGVSASTALQVVTKLRKGA